MLKKYPKLRKLWNRMEKKAPIKLFGSIVKFDKRKKETKEFSKRFNDILISQFLKIDKKRLKSLSKMLESK